MALSPWLKSPFSDINGVLVSSQWYGTCGDIELRAIECLEAYGLDRGLRKCDLLLKDFNECTLKQKQMARAETMFRERRRQYWAGERTKENRYAEAPSPTSY